MFLRLLSFFQQNATHPCKTPVPPSAALRLPPVAPSVTLPTWAAFAETYLAPWILGHGHEHCMLVTAGYCAGHAAWIKIRICTTIYSMVSFWQLLFCLHRSRERGLSHGTSSLPTSRTCNTRRNMGFRRPRMRIGICHRPMKGLG